jgi:imidazolonepropionase-like amidohydrolase
MLVNTDQVRIGVKKYVENELAYKATGLTKFMIYFVMPSIDKKVIDYINKAKENNMFDDLFNPDGCVQLDKVYDRAIFAVDKTGNKILLEKYGLSLDRGDIEKIYQYIRES